MTVPIATAEDFRELAEWIASLGEPGAKDYDPNQLRDSEGRWVRGGAVDVVARVDPLKGHTGPRELPSWGLTQEAQDKVYEKLAAHGITHDALVEKISARIGGKDSDVMKEAAAWYTEAKDMARMMSETSGGQISLEQSEAVLAALSPQTDWDSNLVAAQNVMDFFTSGVIDPDWSPDEMAWAYKDAGLNKTNSTGDNLVKSFAILNGEGIDETLGGLKVRSFFNCIHEPGLTREVAVDGHVLKALAEVSDIEIGAARSLLNAKSPTEGAQYSGAGYIGISEAIRAISTDWDVPPDVVQAAYWLRVREIDWDDMRAKPDE